MVVKFELFGLATLVRRLDYEQLGQIIAIYVLLDAYKGCKSNLDAISGS